jgi:hypothetical protein
MRTFAPFQALILFTTLAVVPVAGAEEPGFTGNVCDLPPPASVAAIPGVSARCKNQEPLPAPGSVAYVGNWSGKTARSATLQVTVAKYTDDEMLKLAIRNLNQGLPGTPKPIGEIGGATAFEATGGFATAIHFSVGKYVVSAVVNTIGTAPPETARTALESLAKAIAPRL